MPIFDKVLRFMLKPWFVVLYLFLAATSYLYLDKNISLYFKELDLNQNLIILTWITNLGMSRLYLAALPILSLICYFILHKKNLSLKFMVLWLLVLYPSLVAWLLKTLLGRARPVLLFNKNEFGFFGWHVEGDYHSFPSGHTTTITSLVIGLTILFPRYFVYWASLCLLVMLSRIMLTFHYLSDVLVSFYLVFLELGVLMYIMRNRFPKTYELILK